MLRVVGFQKAPYLKLYDRCSQVFPDAASTAARTFEAVVLKTTLLVDLGLFCLSGTKRCKDGETL